MARSPTGWWWWWWCGRDTADGQVNGFLIEGGSPGYNARVIEGKGSVRSVWQAHIELDGVRVPLDARLPGANTFRDTGKVLAPTRLTVRVRGARTRRGGA